MHRISPSMLLGACALIGSLASTAVHAEARINIPAKVCDVTAYGADGERQQIQLNTAPIQQAIDDCAAAGGGTVLFPAGHYLTDPLFVKSNIRLQLDKGAILIASSTESSYRPSAENKSSEGGNGWLPFISVTNAKNVAISGEGTIDGQGAVWWERWRQNVRDNPAKRRSTDRPRLIYITNSQNVLIEGVTITNSPSFHVVLRNSEDVDITRTRIISPAFAPHTDAIDPMDSRRVRITHNFIDNNDDHVAIKAEKADPRFPEGVTHDIYIAYNTIKGGRGISIGSESSGGISKVVVEHNSFEGSMYGLRIKSPRGKAGKVTDVVYRDTKMVNVGVPIVFTGYYKGAPEEPEALAKALSDGSFVVGDQIYPPDTDPALPFDEYKTPHFSNITVSKLVSTGSSKAAGYIVGVPEALMSNVVFDDVKIEAQKGLLVRNATITGKKLQIKARQGEALILQKDGVVKK
ncbi:MAG: exo-poly-alpha-D-galacturonosidase [Candidatus Dactylopiibacterium carminicum]|nr:glycoside hydrolase family 28 protein [Candidatus Dactylopiibacterium carminicum]PAS99603.1 MAG: exo-poly-alpha-D-galacturonosidase [Candidatus Dactylopiibacterium carminicum]